MIKYGYSYPQGKQEVKNFLQSVLAPDAKICDMGPGGGTYYNLLGNRYNWTGVEIWHETAEYLKDKYNQIYEMDIRNFEYPTDYDLVIFGDVLEHMTVKEAQLVLQKAKSHSHSILVAVPYKLKQEAIYGNNAEVHIQDDLTPEIFNQRYPDFKLIYQIPNLYGYYYWEKKEV